MLHSHERAEDLLHDVLLTAWGALSNLRDPAKLSSWLYAITRNRIMDLARREERAARGAPRAGPRRGGRAGARMLEREAWLDRMEASIARLPEPFRVILALKYMNDYSCREIAEILDLSWRPSNHVCSKPAASAQTDRIARAKEERAQS